MYKIDHIIQNIYKVAKHIRTCYFSRYTNLISSIISYSSIKYKIFADNTQLYTTLTPTKFSRSVQTLSDCFTTFQILWSQTN